MTTPEHSYPGTLAVRKLADGRLLCVYPMTFGKARLCIGPDDGYSIDDAWCYENPQLAIAVCYDWDGKGDAPLGWHRHIGSGRRRPDGDPEREYVRP
jgi:hypothetical protein